MTWLMHDVYFIVLVFLISLLVASLLYQPVLKYAKKHNIYDKPEKRKLQRNSVPVMGGFVVFFGAVAGVLCYMFKHDCSSIIPVLLAMLVMLLVGAWDDVRKLSPSVRFILEILVVTALALYNHYPVNDLHGLWGVHQFSPWIAWPLTIFACVGIINAVNMIDGIDGLSSGICIIVFGFYGILFFYSLDFVHAALCVCLIGALIPFFIMNVFGGKSKMFIGDAGTMMLGIAICDLLMSMLTHGSVCAKHVEPTHFCLIAFALAVLAIPVFDTFRVMFGRISRGESPFAPDKTHLHHAFIDYGFHHLETSLMEIMLTMMIVGVWWLFYKSHFSEQWQLYAVIAASIAVCYGLYWMLGRRKRISQKLHDMYGISAEEYDEMSDEERKQLKARKQS